MKIKMMCLFCALWVSPVWVSPLCGQDGVVVEGEAVVIQEGVMIEEVMNDGPAVSGEAKGKALGAKRFQLKHVFANEIRMMELACNLDAKQKLKLKIGAKGAVKKLADKWLKDNEMNLGWMLNDGGPVGLAGPDEDEDEEKKKEDDEIVVKEITDLDEVGDNMLMAVVMDDYGNPFTAKHPEDSFFWKKIVKSVLTEEQQKQFVEFKTKRVDQKKELVLNLLVQNLVIELSLDGEQEQKIRELVRPKLMSARRIPSNSFLEPYIYYYYASKVRTSELKKLLSDVQLQQWKIFMAPTKQIGEMVEMENMGGNGGMEEGLGGMVIEMVVESIGDGLLQLFSK